MNDNKKCEYKGLRTDLRNIIACPKCKSHLAIDEVTVGTNRAIMKGRLICVKCGQFYPVIKGIPRLLPGRLSLMKKETSESFGYQWQAFSNKINQWENRCREYFSPFIPFEEDEEMTIKEENIITVNEPKTEIRDNYLQYTGAIVPVEKKIIS